MIKRGGSTVLRFLIMVPQHLSTVLFAIAAACPEIIAEKLRFVLRVSLIIGVPGGLVLGYSSRSVLSLFFGAGYASLATVPLWLLIAGYLPGLPNTVYIAVCRATGRVNQAAVFLSSTAAVQMAAIWVGGRLGGRARRRARHRGRPVLIDTSWGSDVDEVIFRAARKPCSRH